ncbi:hypothetical protein [Phytohabitans rumicis]|uniref:Lipoprotein n=1 Tax=Phytohabitans rumicis TaxID=1076125 RepID=A0A6V8KZW9_9ACTN|nr:hypothetical protein [Phytohabitans rumicis]GFJ87377.1 hypothetical protein Prum_010190 [Phytohabitans rumicis]
MTTARTGGGRILVLVLAGVVLVALVACSTLAVLVWNSGREPAARSLLVRNERPTPITIRVVKPAAEHEYQVLGGDAEALPVNDDCAQVQRIALDEAGTEVARADGVCETMTWIFAADGGIRLEAGRIEPTG